MVPQINFDVTKGDLTAAMADAEFEIILRLCKFVSIEITHKTEKI